MGSRLFCGAPGCIVGHEAVQQGLTAWECQHEGRQHRDCYELEESHLRHRADFRYTQDYCLIRPFFKLESMLSPTLHAYLPVLGASPGAQIEFQACNALADAALGLSA